jgi:hypothetical protein
MSVLFTRYSVVIRFYFLSLFRSKTIDEGHTHTHTNFNDTYCESSPRTSFHVLYVDVLNIPQEFYLDICFPLVLLASLSWRHGNACTSFIELGMS